MKFEKVSRFADVDIKMPVRKTANAAGYDMVAAEDIIIPPYEDLMDVLYLKNYENFVTNNLTSFTLDEMATLTKQTKAKPTLVSTGMKCKLDPNTYLELSVRSSSPLKYWIIMANSVGINC